MMLRASQLASPVLCAITQSLIPTLNLSSSSSLSIFQKPASFASFYKSLNPASNSNSFHIHIISRSFASPKGTFVIVYIHNFILCKAFFIMLLYYCCCCCYFFQLLHLVLGLRVVAQVVAIEKYWSNTCLLKKMTSTYCRNFNAGFL